MPKRKLSKSKDEINKDENDETTTTPQSEIPIKRGRGRPRSTRPIEGDKDKTQEQDQSADVTLSPSPESKVGRRKKTFSRDDSKEDGSSENCSEKRDEPEKRSLRATNSRRSREALVRHMLEESIAAQKSLNEKNVEQNNEDDEEEATDSNLSKENFDAQIQTIEDDDFVDKQPEPIKAEAEESDEKDDAVETPSSKIVLNYLPSSPSPSSNIDIFRPKNVCLSPPSEPRKPICIEVRERYLDDTKDDVIKPEPKNEEENIEKLNETEKSDENQTDSGSTDVPADEPSERTKSEHEENGENDETEEKNSSKQDPANSAGRPSRTRRMSHRPGIEFRIGGRLEACDFMSNWYASKIVDLDWNEKEVLIHFEGWSSRFDEWVSMDSHRLRPITRTSARKEHKQKLKEEFKVHENVLAKWVDGKMYPAKVVSVNANGSCQVTFLDDGIQKTVKPINLSKVSKEEFAYQVSQAKLEKKNRLGERSKKRYVSSSEDDEASDRDEKRSKRDETRRKASKNGKNEKQTSPQGMSVRRKKLLIGGIFQAKRTFQESQTSRKRAPKPRESEPVRPGRKPMRLPGLKMKPGRAKNPKLFPANDKSPDEATLSPEIETVSDEQRKAGSGEPLNLRPPKEFIIEEDHNHFKCPIDNCGKGFRKESLLASHMKHYHDNSVKTTRKREPSSSTTTPKTPLECTPEAVDKDSDLSDDSLHAETKTKSVKKGRGFKHSIAKHKVNIAKRRPMLLYRRKPNEPEPVEKIDEVVSPKSKTSTKKKPVRKSDLAPIPAPENEIANLETPTVTEHDAPSANQSTVGSPTTPIKKSGRKRKWRCNIRSPKKSEISTSIGDAVDVVKSPESPEAPFPVLDDDCSREEVVNCICRVLEEDGLMMQCETCMAWQHGVCFNIEEENKVPEKYVCFACKNPSGQRESYRYWYDQDWWKTGQVARFSFTPKDEEKDAKVANSMLKAHALAGNVLAVKKLLHCLEQKLDLARNGSESNLSTWNKVWSSKPSIRDKNSGLNCGDGRHSALHFDHSYSFPTKNGVEVKTDDSSPSTPVVEIEEKMEILEPPKLESDPPTLNGIDKVEVPIDIITTVVKDEDDKTFSLPDNNYTLFLDHLEQMQDEVDHRLDEISQHIEALEVEWDDDSFSSHSLGDLPVVKKMLKVLQVNLDKVLRMATYH